MIMITPLPSRSPFEHFAGTRFMKGISQDLHRQTGNHHNALPTLRQARDKFGKGQPTAQKNHHTRG